MGGNLANIDLAFKGKDEKKLQTAIVRCRGDDPHGTEELPLYTSGGSVFGDVRDARLALISSEACKFSALYKKFSSNMPYDVPVHQPTLCGSQSTARVFKTG